ncbi:MAG: ThiF family adenylyltransferase [Acidobacteriia bacterium]|nr:ThiF family adenylyltransferase [Terriglobia bacterium]
MADLQIKDPAMDRYHSLALSSVWELARIRQACALVVGAGALGNEVCKNLAMMGVALIVVLDRDTVEVANLSRSAFFRESDHGRLKAEVICERLKDLNPDVELQPLAGDLDEVLGLGVVRRADMVFSCLDSRLARRSLNRMCEKLSKPWVDGAMENLLGEVNAYLPGEGPCYECKLTAAAKTALAEAASCRGIALRNLSRGKVPTTSTMGSIIAALQVQEAVKMLHGDFQNALVGKRLVVNCTINDFYISESERKDDCPGHFRYGEITEGDGFSAASTSASDLLARFAKDNGEEGAVDLGREVVIALRCSTCGETEVLGQPLRRVGEEAARCPRCGQIREPETTHAVRGTEAYAQWPLSRLGIPKLDVLEVRGSSAAVWYELTGDLQSFPHFGCPELAPVADKQPAEPTEQKAVA